MKGPPPSQSVAIFFASPSEAASRKLETFDQLLTNFRPSTALPRPTQNVFLDQPRDRYQIFITLPPKSDMSEIVLSFPAFFSRVVGSKGERREGG